MQSTKMKSATEDHAAGRFEVRVTADTHFSMLRTRMSVERTLMSWMRTAVALIGFGFTIVQFFERFNSMDGVAAAMQPAASRYFGLALILAGIGALLISLWQYRTMLRYLKSGPFAPLTGVEGLNHSTPTVAAALVLAAIGAFAFVAVLTRMA
jgi:putative membrane protein